MLLYPYTNRTVVGEDFTTNLLAETPMRGGGLPERERPIAFMLLVFARRTVLKARMAQTTNHDHKDIVIIFRH